MNGLGLREAGVYYVLVLLVAVLAIATALSGGPNYLSVLNLTNIVYQASLVAIMGVAMTVVLITGAFDLSVASVAALAAAVLVMLAGQIGFWPAVLVALAVSGAIGVVNGAIVQFVGVNAFIVTLGSLTAVRGLVLVLTGGRAVMVEAPKALAQMSAFEAGRVGLFWPLIALGAVLLLVAGRAALKHARPWRAGLGGAVLIAAALAAGPGLSVPNPIVYMLGFTAVVWFVLGFTTLGRRVYAVGGNPEAARLAGIDVKGLRLAAFVLSGLAAGFAGVLFGCRLGAVNPTALQGTELTVIAAAILGGTSLFGGAGSVLKTVAGALLLFTLSNGFNVLNLGANWQGLIEGVVLVAAAAIYTLGGRRVAPKKAAPLKETA
jgi:ribose/xylose/arabinose/galactoside ABC-type transport system permease subunit